MDIITFLKNRDNGYLTLLKKVEKVNGNLVLIKTRKGTKMAIYIKNKKKNKNGK